MESTQRDTVAARTAPIAMHAVAQLMLDRRLPAPMAIHGPRRCKSAEKALRIDLYSGDIEAWVEATDADYESTVPGEDAGGEVCVLVTWRGTVASPVGVVAVVLRIVQRTSSRPRLSVVGGETA